MNILSLRYVGFNCIRRVLNNAKKTWRSERSGRLLRFKGAVAAIGAAVGVPYGGRAVAVRNAPVFGEDFGCPLVHHGHHLQRYFSKPFFRNHFTVKCENGDLRF